MADGADETKGRKNRPGGRSGGNPRWRPRPPSPDTTLALLRQAAGLVGGTGERRHGRCLAVESLVELGAEHGFDAIVVGHAEAAAGGQRLALHGLDDSVRTRDLVVERYVGGTERRVGKRQVAGALVPF